jgi:acyl-CoA reductase-like NAD-dependent aldehyde dehydrogenase
MEAIHHALAQDLGRNRVDTITGDTGMVLHEVVYAYNNVEKWVKDVKPSTTMTFQLMDLRVKPTPKGVVLIVSPFNYPFNLTLTPLVGALAAGCTVVIKLPESLRTVSPLMQKLLEQYMDRNVVRVVQGAVPEMTEVSSSIPSMTTD